MARINLLPWREEQRQERKKEFLVALGAMAVLGILIVLLVSQIYGAMIDQQRGRNQYLQQHIDELNRQVREIADLERQRRELLDRMRVIQELQGNRPIIVRLFDEMVRTLPDGVYYEALDRNNVRLDILGIAESNNRVSSLMRNLDRSEWFDKPNLTAVKAFPDFGEQASRFQLSVRVSMPEAGSEER